ncbi:MAG: hypothetical protein ABL933_06435 [Methyloglobulus sp.]|nr:hypothetical protein [Methyloglobulus sp.]
MSYKAIGSVVFIYLLLALGEAYGVVCYGLWLPIMNLPLYTRPTNNWQANRLAGTIANTANCTCPEKENSTGFGWDYDCTKTIKEGEYNEFKIVLFTEKAFKNGEADAFIKDYAGSAWELKLEDEPEPKFSFSEIESQESIVSSKVSSTVSELIISGSNTFSP